MKLIYIKEKKKEISEYFEGKKKEIVKEIKKEITEYFEKQKNLFEMFLLGKKRLESNKDEEKDIKTKESEENNEFKKGEKNEENKDK